MAVAQPDFLLIFNEPSGTAVTNYGTQASGYAIQAGSSPGDYEWNPQAVTPTAGFLDLKTVGAGLANVPKLTTAATAPSAGQQPCCMALGFKIDNYDTTLTRSYIVGGYGSGSVGGYMLQVVAPIGSGNYDLLLTFRTAGGYGWSVVLSNRERIAGLTFGTFYQIAAYGAFSGSDMTLRYKLGSGSVIAPTAVSNGADSLAAGWPELNSAVIEGFLNYGAIDGQIYYFAFDRNGASWSDTDLADINSNPSTAITGWPAGGPARPVGQACI